EDRGEAHGRAGSVRGPRRWAMTTLSRATMLVTRMSDRLRGAGGDAMSAMRLEVPQVRRGQLWMVTHDQQVLGVLVLGLAREVEAARDHRPLVDDHDLVVG